MHRCPVNEAAQADTESPGRVANCRRACGVEEASGVMRGELLDDGGPSADVAGASAHGGVHGYDTVQAAGCRGKRTDEL
jgi:hypothetical protein